MALIPQHRESIYRIEVELKENKKQLFNTLTDSSISKDSILNEIAQKQIEIEKVH